jgi:spore germination protein GerM
MTVTLYFATKDASALVAEKREVAKNNHPARTALEELIAGPKNTELTKVVPSSVQVKDIRIKDHVAYVDFSESFVKEHWGGSAGEILTISAVINTLTEFSEIKRVQFLVEGKVLETLKGHLDTSDPLPRNEAIIKK